MLAFQVFDGWGGHIWRESVNIFHYIFCAGYSANDTIPYESVLPRSSEPIGNAGTIFMVTLKWIYIIAIFNSSQFFFVGKGLMITFGFTLMEIIDAYKNRLQLCASVQDVCVRYQLNTHMDY